MKRHLLIKCTIIGLAGCLFFSGCAERNVDYNIDENTETESLQRGKAGVKQFADAAAWTEEWKETTSKGNEVTLSIDAKVIAPTVDQMSVVEVKETIFDEEFKESMVRRFFGNEEVYYNDIRNLTKKELTELRAEYETLYEMYSGEGMEMEREIYQCKMKECDDALENAKDTHTPAENFAVGSYWGNRAGVPYNLNFLEDQFHCSNKDIDFSPREVYQVCPQKFRKVENLTYEYWDLKSHGSLTENSCELSEEEAKKEAQSFVEHLGLGDMCYEYSWPLVWGDGVKQSEWAADGYVFQFGFGMDGMSFAEFGTEEEYWQFMMKRKEKEEPHYSLNARMTVSVSEAGVIGARISNPVEVVHISEGVELLPFQDIQDIMKEQLNNHLGFFRFSFSRMNVNGLVEFNEMELIYFRVRNKNEPEYYSYIPAWRLADVVRDGRGKVDGIQNQVLINAIDGSVINFYEET